MKDALYLILISYMLIALFNGFKKSEECSEVGGFYVIGACLNPSALINTKDVPERKGFFDEKR